MMETEHGMEEVHMMSEGDSCGDGKQEQSTSDEDACTSECSIQSQEEYHEQHTEIITSDMTGNCGTQLDPPEWQKSQMQGCSASMTAAILSMKKRKRPHSFETNPSVRKRQQNRLLRKLRTTIDEFATRVGQQAIVLVANPGKETGGYRCFGARPLEDVIKALKSVIMNELEQALARHAPAPIPDDPSLYELPPLVLDGVPTPVEKMTQAQLRCFIPLMLKYSTGRGKPGWGRESTRPPWWPPELPWANVRMDARSEQDKQKVSWTKALRQIVINCYKFHGREDLLPTYTGDEDGRTPGSPSCETPPPTEEEQSEHQHQVSPFGPTVLQTVTNPDGTVSLIHVDPSNPIITLPDGTTAHVRGVAAIHSGRNEHESNVHSGEVSTSQGEGVTQVELLNNITEAALNQEGQIIITGEDGQGYPVSVSNMLSVPVSASVYQTVVANDGTVQVTPMVHVPKSEENHANDTGGMNRPEMETISLAPHQVIAVGSDGESQLLQVISIKEENPVNALSAMNTRS